MPQEQFCSHCGQITLFFEGRCLSCESGFHENYEYFSNQEELDFSD